MSRRLLLDTHVILWWLLDDSRLNTPSRDLIYEADQVFVSAASIWEAGIKMAMGKLEIPARLSNVIESNGFEDLSISCVHAELAGGLPPHHKDPFDRMLIAQAKVEELLLVTHDRKFAPYDIELCWT